MHKRSGLLCSYSAFRKGDQIAVAGMRFVYGQEETNDEIANRHECLLEELLEEEKLRRAEEIARKRAAGYDVPPDPLTSEAMVAQKAAHIAEVQKASVELHEARNFEKRRIERGAMREKETIALLGANPEMNAHLLAERLGIGVRMAYCILKALKDKGVIWQEDKRWRINIVGLTFCAMFTQDGTRQFGRYCISTPTRKKREEELVGECHALSVRLVLP